MDQENKDEHARLERINLRISWTRTYTALIMDALETLTVAVFIILLVYRSLKTRDGHAKGYLSLNIYL